MEQRVRNIMQQLINVKPIENTILLTFNDYFEQEDLIALNKKIFSGIPTVKILELIEGADRLTCRFHWENSYFYCHFEVNSQSCWIEAEDIISQNEIARITQFLKSFL